MEAFRRTLRFERQVRSESLIPRGDAIHAQVTVSNRCAAERALELLEQPRSRQNTPRNADSLLSHVEITGDFDFKDHNDGNHFLGCEIDSRVAAHTYLKRKKQGSAASKVQLEDQGQHSGFQHRALLQSNYLSLPWYSLFTW